jgi:peptide/nickel transport system substrate-binding protein
MSYGYTMIEASEKLTGDAYKQCELEISSQVADLMIASTPPLYVEPNGDDICPSYKLTKAQAEQNVVWIDNRLDYYEENVDGWQAGTAAQQNRQHHESLRISNRNCVAYFEERDENKELATGVGEQLGITEEEAKNLVGGEENAKKIYDSNCVIATAAFGSEIAPQVQFLRGFRDNHILSTAAGSSFMSVFNAWYYSFSPSVAAYERGQPWMQQTVRTAIYPLLGILHTSEKAYSSIPGEFGAMSAGLVASAMIGAVYFSPVALSIKQVRKSGINYRIAAGAIAAISVALVVSIAAGNEAALMITSSLFVLGIIIVSALLFAKMLARIGNMVSGYFNKKDNN